MPKSQLEPEPPPVASEPQANSPAELVSIVSQDTRLGTVKLPVTRKAESIVELALTKIPDAVEVGVMALVNRNCHAPGSPAAPPPVADSSPPEKVRLLPIATVKSVEDASP